MANNVIVYYCANDSHCVLGVPPLYLGGGPEVIHDSRGGIFTRRKSRALQCAFVARCKAITTASD